jgi:hypothetical protein
MSHKLQLHLLLDHISAKITANAAIGLRSLANPRSRPIHPFVARNSGYHRREIDIGGGYHCKHAHVREIKCLTLALKCVIRFHFLKIFFESTKVLMVATCTAVGSPSSWACSFLWVAPNSCQVLWATSAFCWNYRPRPQQSLFLFPFQVVII